MKRRSLLHNCEGSVGPIFALSLMAIVALAGAALALGMDQRAANDLQITADEAALAGATAFVAEASPRSEDRLAAAYDTALSSASGNAEYFLTDLEVTPLTEDAYGQHTEIEVQLGFSPANPAANLIGRNANVEIHRRATASATWGFPLCILSLEKSANGLSVSDQSDVEAKDCIIWSNSKSKESMKFSGGRAETKYFCAAGNARVSGASVTPRPHEKCDAIPDPLDSWSAPAAGLPEVYGSIYNPTEPLSRNKNALAAVFDKIMLDPILKPLVKDVKSANQKGLPISDAVQKILMARLDEVAKNKLFNQIKGLKFNPDGTISNGAAAGLTPYEVAQIIGLIDNIPQAEYISDSYIDYTTDTIYPGTYAGLDISRGNVKLQPGIYHIVGAPLTVRRKATLEGEGVTIIFHGDDATFNIMDEARLTLTGPTSGPTAGLILAQDKGSVSTSRTNRSRITGSGTIEAIGTVYLPDHLLSITGSGAADQTSPLLQIVARQVEIAEQGALKIHFAPEDTDVPVAIAPAREARLIR